jgi:hypothetical protein
MKLKAASDKIILVRKDVLARAMPLGMNGRPLAIPPVLRADPKAPNTIGRIVSIGPDVKGPFKVGQLVVFGTAAQVTFRDGTEYVITVAGGILATVEDDDVVGEITADGAQLVEEAASP